MMSHLEAKWCLLVGQLLYFSQMVKEYNMIIELKFVYGNPV